MGLQVNKSNEIVEYIVELVESKSDSELAVVCVPFGGGDPINFIRTAAAIRKQDPNVDVYSIVFRDMVRTG